MHSGEGEIRAIYYEEAEAAGSLRCSPVLVPAPGQYNLAVSLLKTGEAAEVLAVPLFFSGQAEGGFAFAAEMPEHWRPGTRLGLRGPIGHGFAILNQVKRAALVTVGRTTARLRGLIPALMAQKAEVALVCGHVPAGLPEEIEIHPIAAMEEICRWADYVAVDAEKEALPELTKQLRSLKLKGQVQVLVHTPMPCGAMAECGACAVTARAGWKMACKDGPVFELEELGESANLH